MYVLKSCDFQLFWKVDAFIYCQKRSSISKIYLQITTENLIESIVYDLVSININNNMGKENTVGPYGGWFTVKYLTWENHKWNYETKKLSRNFFYLFDVIVHHKTCWVSRIPAYYITPTTSAVLFNKSIFFFLNVTNMSLFNSPRLILHCSDCFQSEVNLKSFAT